jgi:hypothetical protein
MNLYCNFIRFLVIVMPVKGEKNSRRVWYYLILYYFKKEDFSKQYYIKINEKSRNEIKMDQTTPSIVLGIEK